MPPNRNRPARLLATLAAAVLTCFAAAQSMPCEGPPDQRLVEWTHYYAQGFGLDPLFMQAVVQAESRYCPNAVSKAGAIGLGQLMPSTAAALGVNAWDPLQNLWGTAAYLRQKYLEWGDWTLALAAYNAGSGAVRKYGGVPPYQETHDYIRRVYTYYRAFRGE